MIHQPVKNNLRIYDNIQKISTGQRDDCITCCFLDYFYFKKYYKMIAIAVADLKAIKQINFTGNLD